MLQQDLLRGFVVRDEVAMGTNIVDDTLLLLSPVDAHHQTQIQIGGRGGRNDIGGSGSGLARGESVDVQ